MDPVGPWYASYNRLTAGSGSGGFPVGLSSAGGEFVAHHLSASSLVASGGGQGGGGSAIVIASTTPTPISTPTPPQTHQATPTTVSTPTSTPSSASSSPQQILLQAASLAGQPTPFNPGGFLSPPPVGYDVFSPLFHHPNAKQQAHYVNQHRQALAQLQQQQQQQQTAAITSPGKSDSQEAQVSPSLRENAYNASGASFYEAQTNSSSAGSSSAWSHQPNSQIPSPFGILPHESVVVPSSPGTSSSGKSSGTYESTYNSHFPGSSPSAASSPTSGSSSAAAAFEQGKKSVSRTASSPTTSGIVGAISKNSNLSGNSGSSATSVTSKNPNTSKNSAASAIAQNFFQQQQQQQQQIAANFVAESLASSNNYNSVDEGKNHQNVNLQQQQSCIVTTLAGSINPSKDYRIPQLPLVTRAQTAGTTIFLNTSVRTTASQEKTTSRGYSTSPSSSSSSSSSSSNKTASNAQQQQQVQTKAQTKIYPGEHENNNNNNSQSSPISFSMMDSRNLSYSAAAAAANGAGGGNNSANNGPNNGANSAASGNSSGNNASKIPTNPRTQFHILTQQQQQQQQQQSSSYHRHYQTGASPGESDYHHQQPQQQQQQQQQPLHLHQQQQQQHHHHLSRGKSSNPSVDTTYSTAGSQSNGPDCSGVVVPRRPSPLQAHSQASPLGHVPSPAYPMYNSPMTTMSSPSPLQHNNSSSSNNNNNGNANNGSNNAGSTGENSNNHCPTAGNYKTSVVQQQQQQQQQVAPPSPLDVTLPRPPSQGQVAYSSVITRVLGNPETSKSPYSNLDNRNYVDRQEFGQKQQQQQQQQQICWENDARQARKFSISPYSSQASTTSNANAPNDLQQNLSMQQQQQQQQQQAQRVLNISDRQQVYFDSSQVTLHDLSSCRGDPMSIVKNLQTLQQTPLGQTSQGTAGSMEAHPKVTDDRQRKGLDKKRRSFDKIGHSVAAAAAATTILSTSSTGTSSGLNDLAGAAAMTEYLARIPPPAHHNSNQQTQNGGYFDFERWNIGPPPTASSASTTSPAPLAPITTSQTKIFPGSSAVPQGFTGQNVALHHPGGATTFNSSGASSASHHNQVPSGGGASSGSSLMMPHHHHHHHHHHHAAAAAAAAAALPYFPAFHLPPGPHHPHPHGHGHHPHSHPHHPGSGHEYHQSGSLEVTPLTLNDNSNPGVQNCGISAAAAAAQGLGIPAGGLPVGLPGASALNAANSSSSASSCYQDHPAATRDDQPKVIVPNIEEELGFLQQQQIHPNAQIPHQTGQPGTNTGQHLGIGTPGAGNSLRVAQTPSQPKDPNSGFMTSYLKFLQGDREPSPPLALRHGRKATWNKSKPYVPAVPTRKPNSGMNDANGDFNAGKDKSSSSSSSTIKEQQPVIDYANDPRYFPLPKERKNRNFDSSDDDGFTSDDDFPFASSSGNNPTTGSKKNEGKKNSGSSAGIANISAASSTAVHQPKVETVKARKGRPPKPGGAADRRRKAAAAAASASNNAQGEGKYRKYDDDSGSLVPPRRETSKRKAKEKGSARRTLEISDNEEEQGDSDSDPAWTPAVTLIGEEEDKKRKRGRPVISKKSRRLLDDEDYSSGEAPPPKSRGRKRNDAASGSKKMSCKIDEKLLASVSDEDIDISPFKRSMEDSEDWSGEFVVIKADLDEEFPALWRIDGKTLLQKYEPFQSNGKTLYRNISTYSGWAPQNRHIYQQVPVKFWQQGKVETVVEFLRDEMIIDDSECIDRSMKETEKYQDNFEVYIQTLISQALDSNFLTEIFQEQDDYFLSNVKTVDEITEERKRRLLSTTKWQPSTITALSTWPCLNVLKDLLPAESKGKQCAGCQSHKVHARILLYGQPYNSTTLEGSPPDPRVHQEKDFVLCRVCLAKIMLFNKVAHQKYLMFVECARRVADKRVADPHKDTTIILNELLADESWLNQLFKEVRGIWAEIDSIEHQATTAATVAGNLKKSEPEVPENTPTSEETGVKGSSPVITSPTPEVPVAAAASEHSSSQETAAISGESAQLPIGPC